MDIPKFKFMNGETDFSFTNHQSPIEAIVKEITTDIASKYDECVYNAISEVGVVVDREELVKALQYDRGQYLKGYADGFANADKEIAKEIFEEIENAWMTTYYESEFEERLANLKKKYTEGENK